MHTQANTQTRTLRNVIDSGADLLDDKAAKAWLITILRRENARRFERKQFDLVDLDEHPQSDQEALHSEQEMENEWLRRHIARLPAEYQEPLLLQVLGGFSGEEIAAQLGLNKNTVMTRLFRARNQIKEAIEAADAASGEFAARRMDASIRKVLTGQNVNKV